MKIKFSRLKSEVFSFSRDSANILDLQAKVFPIKISPNFGIILIILAAAFLRFYRIEQLTTFSGDQGYDFIIVKRVIIDHDFTLLGPKIGPYNNLGNLYLGPAYYYLILIPLLLFNLDPIGPAIFSAFLSVLTVGIIYVICKKYFSASTALLASSLFAFNNLLISQSRSTSNPHLTPFFSSVIIYSVFEIISSSQRIVFPIICGIFLGIIFQLHYLAISSAIAVFIILIIYRKFKELFIVCLSFIAALSPQLLFELRNDFFVTKLFLRQTQESPNFLSFTHFLKSLSLSSSVLMNQLFPYGYILFIFVSLAILFVLLKENQKRKYYLFILISLISSLLVSSLYKGPILIHYFSNIYVSLILLVSLAITFCIRYFKSYYIKLLAIAFVLQIFAVYFLNLDLENKNGYTMPKGWNLTGIKKTTSIIINDPDSVSKFNVASTLDGDTRAMPYRYFLEAKGKKPLDVESYPNAKVIYLISRDEPEVINSYTVWEVSSFKPFEVSRLSEVQNSIYVYKLIKND